MQPYLYEYKYFTIYFKDRILQNLSNIKADCTCIEICIQRGKKILLERERDKLLNYYESEQPLPLFSL